MTSSTTATSPTIELITTPTLPVEKSTGCTPSSTSSIAAAAMTAASIEVLPSCAQ